MFSFFVGGGIFVLILIVGLFSIVDHDLDYTEHFYYRYKNFRDFVLINFL